MTWKKISKDGLPMVTDDITIINSVTRLRWHGDVSAVFHQPKPVHYNPLYISTDYTNKHGDKFTLKVFYQDTPSTGWTARFVGEHHAGNWQRVVDTPALACVAFEAWCRTNL